jgi:hypothetical protein
MDARFCGNCGTRRLSSIHRYCSSCGRRFAGEPENAPAAAPQSHKRFTASQRTILAILGPILCAGLLFWVFHEFLPKHNSAIEQASSVATGSYQARAEMTPVATVTNDTNSPLTRPLMAQRFYIAATTEGALVLSTNDSFKDYDDCEMERVSIAQGRGRPDDDYGLLRDLVTMEMRCLSDTDPAWHGLPPEDRWFFFSGIDTNSTTKTMRCRSKDETFSLLLTSEIDISNPGVTDYKTEALCTASANHYTNDMISSWSRNGIAFHRNDWPNPACAYCVRVDDPIMNRSSP